MEPEVRQSMENQAKHEPEKRGAQGYRHIVQCSQRLDANRRVHGKHPDKIQGMSSKGFRSELHT